ncbi:MAG TPA: DUF2268 domain-containing putative Zn-dependent protease [Chloroflexia bacterium]|nr:DUF2268 domain-containing putative Zn-dependent protease [Chloroflexia bacterium]
MRNMRTSAWPVLRAWFLTFTIAFLLSGCGEDVTPVSLSVATQASPVVSGTTTSSVPQAITASAVTTTADTGSAVTSTTANSAATTGEIDYELDPGLSSAERAEIEQGIALSQKAFGDVGHIKVSTSKALSVIKQEDNLLGSATPGEIVLYISTESWKEATSVEHIVTVIHEYYHNFQFYLSGKSWQTYGMTRDSSVMDPWWMVEGSAEYISNLVASDNKLLKWSNVLHEKKVNAYLSPYPLSTIEKYSDNPPIDPYFMGFLATGYLTKEYGGTEALKNYWKALSTASNWEDAFKSAFGATKQVFYTNFENYRLKEYPSTVPVGSLPLPDFKGLFKVKFLGNLSAGTARGIEPELVPYVFSFSGFVLDDMSTREIEAALQLPEKDDVWYFVGGNSIMVCFDPNHPKGQYKLGIKLKDGRNASVSFQIPSTVHLITP